MNAIWAKLEAALRGPRVSRFLERRGVDARRFWLLVDLLETLSERGEMMDQLGRDGVALRTAAWLYAAIGALLAAMLVVQGAAPRTYLAIFCGFTAFILAAVLMSEASNSLLNPAEAQVLAHQPIDGATYTAAKLSHLLRIVLVFVAGLDGVPAACGVLLPRAHWTFPLVLLSAALGIGLAIGCICCALFVLLMRFIPAKRLRAGGQLLGTLPFLGGFGWQWVAIGYKKLARSVHVSLSPAAGIAIGTAAAVLFLAAIAFGIRSLSADYLVRVSVMMHGAKPRRTLRRRALFGVLVSKFFGGPAARAGFAYTAVMMRRDWQFRRQIIPMAIMLPLGFGPLIASRWHGDPFSRQFSTMHLLPHFIGMMLAFVCGFLSFGADYKGIWVFLLAPADSIARFARGVWALLWIAAIAVPHLVLLPLLLRTWGPVHGALFTAYSLAAASVYLALEMRLVEHVPFSTQMDPARSAVTLPILMLGAVAMAVAVGLQWLLFLSTPAVAVATVALYGAAWLLTRNSLESAALSMRHNLGTVSRESSALYAEVGR
jgi:hypothetical protein